MDISRARDRLQPALLDRLTDEDPTQQTETSEARAINRSRLRDLVLRDLAWLFNATAADASIDWSDVPHAQKSVLNFGLPALSGQSHSSVNLLLLQSKVKQAILDHEPRILPATLSVEVALSNTKLDHHNLIGFHISGQLWAQPVPLELLLRTDIDVETGRVSVREIDR